MRVATKKKRSGAAGLAAIPVVLITIVFFVILSISILVTLPIAGAVGLGIGGYFLMYDGKTEQIEIDENFDMKAYGEEFLLSSFDDAEQTKKIQVVVTKDVVNNLLYQALNSFNLEELTKGYVKNDLLNKAYLTIDGNDYHFYVDINAKVADFSLLKTRVHLTTTLYEKYSTNSFVFKIKDIAFGKLYGMKGLAKKALTTFVKDEMINEFISKIGLSLQYNQSNLSISYAKNDIINDLIKITGATDNMYIDVAKALLNKNLINFDFGSDSLIEGYVDLTKLQTNEYVTDTIDQVIVNSHDVVTNCKDKVIQLMNDGKIGHEISTENLTNIFQFLFLGYEGSSDQIKDTITPIDFSSVGINDVTTYKGFDLTCNNELLLNRMSSTVNTASLMHGGTDVCRLTEEDINEYIRGSSLVGYTTILNRFNKDGEFKLNFVTIDNFYCNIYQDAYNGYQPTVDFIVKINLNGCPTSLAFSTIIPEDGLKNNSITFAVKDIKYGEMGGEDLVNMFFGIISSALDGGDSSISANQDKHTITFNFSAIIQEAKQSVEQEVRQIPGKESWSADSIFNSDNVLLEVFGENKEDVGQFGITLKEPVQVM